MSPSAVSDAQFLNLVQFLLICCFSEALCTFFAIRYTRSTFPFDPLDNIGEFVRKRWIVFFLSPLVLHLPLLSLVFVQSGMGVQVGV